MTATTLGTRRSTTVRTPPRVRAIRAAFAALERVAPRQASRWSLRLWATLPGNAGRRRDERTADGELSVVRLNGRSVAVETWGSGEPVYLVHGWGGWRGQLGRFVDPLVNAGVRVVALDAPGHGDSDPGSLGAGRGNGMEFVEALRAVAAVHGGPHAVIAHSFGCATTTTAVRDGLDVDRLAFVAPGVDPLAYVRGLQRVFGFGPRTVEEMIIRIERLAGRSLSDFDPRTMINPRPPTLIVHDRQDKECPYDDAVSLTEAWPAADLITTDGLGHQRILRDETVIKDVVDYVSR
ncbi:alpha/beta fold hydrolase [Microlunatus sp. Gsoil 973]|uniref:alpha/beta fold hydrolase n=1 Tax=Microlunatus sp. Gsoil 973 TaxID=2672569 RepID=UPI0012B5038B|nr:alpha/beta fold hydrolase [Microlunatus sp. Gsoil 973]QGN33055.1 alpha/beta fold hydrolase [Microlunatus sp. Gsoil 973]